MDKWISILKGKLDPNQARMGSASSIISIIFCCSSIESIPAEIAEFSKLAKLDCSFNAIKQINGDLFPKLTALSTLDLKSNQIHTLPNEIRALKSLRYLNLFKNRISTINSAIWEGLVNLKFLDLSRNEIQELPDSLFNCCQNLETLLLNHNKIRVIQDQIRNLGKLKKVDHR
jgi:Leucine-rich repeat (LRR) protein